MLDCAHCFIGYLEGLVCEIVCHKLCTPVILVQLLVFQVGRPHGGADKFLQEYTRNMFVT